LCCSCIDLCVKDAKKSLKEKFFKTNSDFYIPNVHKEQAKQLDSIIKKCVESGESNSVLIIGPRGSGKSKLLSNVLLNIHNNFNGDYFYVYLNGLVHTDDRTALQDTARQLELENVVGDRVFVRIICR